MSRYTPGPGGYALAVVVSVLVVPGVFAVMGTLTGDGIGDPAELALAWPVRAAWAAIPGSAVGLIGVLLVHGWCRDQPSQAVHVAAARDTAA